jgi:hypothetical protein
MVSESGSGITIFVIQSHNPLNTTMTLDGNISTTASISGFADRTDLAYNVTLYTVQSLPATPHTLDVALVDYINDDETTTGSIIRFDSAAVEETPPSITSPLSSGAGAATPTTDSPALSSGSDSRGTSRSK